MVHRELGECDKKSCFLFLKYLFSFCFNDNEGVLERIIHVVGGRWYLVVGSWLYIVCVTAQSVMAAEQESYK